MSETPGPPITLASATSPPSLQAPPQRSGRLYQIAAWVAIIAGIVFIAATVLFVICMFSCCH